MDCFHKSVSQSTIKMEKGYYFMLKVVEKTAIYGRNPQ